MKFFYLIPTVLLLGFLAGCSQGNAAKGVAGAPVLTAKVVETNLPVMIDPAPVGHVVPVSSVTVRPQVGGIINTVEFREGQEVKKNDLLFTIDPRPAQAALVQAQAALQRDTAQMENARIQFERDDKLYAAKVESQDVYDTSKANMDAMTGTVAADRASVTNAELNVEYTQIRSPIDGRTGSLQFHPGNVVKSPDDVLLTINQIHPIYVNFSVAERFLPEIRKQMALHTLAVTATFDNLEGPPPPGELTFVDNAVDTTTGTIQLKATFQNEDGKLWPGQFVRVQMTLSELSGALIVPSQAVQVGQEGQFVYVVKPDDTADQRPVKPGMDFDGQTVIQSGLKAGETVVTDGQLRLAPGVKVSVKAAATGKP